MSPPLINMLGTEKNESQWKDYVSTVAHAYNCTRNNAIEVSLYFCMYGMKERLPIDLYCCTLIEDICASTSKKSCASVKGHVEMGLSGEKRSQ